MQKLYYGHLFTRKNLQLLQTVEGVKERGMGWGSPSQPTSGLESVVNSPTGFRAEPRTKTISVLYWRDRTHLIMSVI